MWLYSWNEQIPWDTNSKAYSESKGLLELALCVLRKKLVYSEVLLQKVNCFN